MHVAYFNYFDYSMANLAGFSNSIVYGYLSFSERNRKIAQISLNE